jgi:hypothetical protein
MLVPADDWLKRAETQKTTMSKEDTMNKQQLNSTYHQLRDEAIVLINHTWSGITLSDAASRLDAVTLQMGGNKQSVILMRKAVISLDNRIDDSMLAHAIIWRAVASNQFEFIDALL